jgi:hypothetical protein
MNKEGSFAFCFGESKPKWMDIYKPPLPWYKRLWFAIFERLAGK